MLLLIPKPTEPAPSTTRNKTGVVTLVKKAPSGQRWTLEQWLAWLRANW